MSIALDMRLLLALGTAAALVAGAADEDASVPESLRPIAERNIFDPERPRQRTVPRSPQRVERRTVRRTISESATLVGVLIDGPVAVAFFESERSDLQGRRVVGEELRGYVVESVRSGAIELRAGDDHREIPVGGAVRFERETTEEIDEARGSGTGDVAGAGGPGRGGRELQTASLGRDGRRDGVSERRDRRETSDGGRRDDSSDNSGRDSGGRLEDRRDSERRGSGGGRSEDRRDSGREGSDSGPPGNRRESDRGGSGGGPAGDRSSSERRASGDGRLEDRVDTGGRLPTDGSLEQSGRAGRDTRLDRGRDGDADQTRETRESRPDSVEEQARELSAEERAGILERLRKKREQQLKKE